MVRRPIKGLVSIVLAAAFGATVVASVAPTPPASAAGCEGGLSSADLNELLRGGRRGPGGMAGMDYAHVHRLPDGRVLWLFQDAFLGDVSHLGDAAFVHNAGLVQFGSCVKVLHSGTRSTPRSWIGAGGETPLSRWFWPLDGVMGNDGVFRQFMVEMRNPNGTGAAVGAAPVRVWIASISLSDLAVTSLVPAPDDDDRPLYGFSVAGDGAWTYLYGHCYRQFTDPGYAGAHDPTCGPHVYVARVPAGDLNAVPQYWNGADWVADRSAAVPVMVRGTAANPMQVRNVGGAFVAVTKIDDWFGTRVYVDMAPTATGPWNEIAYIDPELVCGQCSTYFAHLLPWGDSDGSMLIAISNNAWSFELARANPRYYRPRVMSVRAPVGVELPPPPADCTISATLKRRGSGSQTKCLRRRLHQLGYAVDPGKTRFDDQVRAAVMAFQESHGLDPDGIVGRDTGRALGIRDVRRVTPGATPGPTSCRVTSTLRLGASGSQVSCLNSRLRALGYTIDGSAGRFAASTRAAVRAFQGARGLAADGVVGPATRRALGV